jgi:hypothetical protein
MPHEKIDYSMRLEPPSLDLYRRGWTPAPGVELGGMWVSGIVTDSSGQDYLALRGWGDFIRGTTHTVSPFCGFRAIEKRLDGEPPHLFSEYATHDWFEPYQHRDSAGSVEIAYDSGSFTRDAEGCHWWDADGRWELHGPTISQVFIVHVPRQDGIDHEVYYRHELVKAHGTINGIAVEGHLHQDYAFGPPGTTYTDLPIARHLEGMWVSWVSEQADGELGGGCFWQGRDGLPFGPGYLLRDGKTTVHGDFATDVTLNSDGKITALRVSVDGEVLDFTLTSVAGPLHVLGRLTAAPSGKPLKDSWCWIEYPAGMLTPEILDMMNERYHVAWGR